MLVSNNIVGALLAFRRQVAICEVVADQALMTGDLGAVGNSKTGVGACPCELILGPDQWQH